MIGEKISLDSVIDVEYTVKVCASLPNRRLLHRELLNYEKILEVVKLYLISMFYCIFSQIFLKMTLKMNKCIPQENKPIVCEQVDRFSDKHKGRHLRLETLSVISVC